VARSGGGQSEFEFDNNGNRIAGDGEFLACNAFNKPVLIDNGSSRSTFSYGADLLRGRAAGLPPRPASHLELYSTAGTDPIRPVAD